MPKSLDITVPDLTGKLALVTGASDGVGFEIAARLARSGAELIMPVRNLQKGEEAAARIRERTPDAGIHVRSLDLSSLDRSQRSRMSSSRGPPARHPDQQRRRHEPADAPADRRRVRAAVRDQPPRSFRAHRSTAPLLRAGRAHVTSQVSIAADQGAINWDDLSWERDYDPMKAYSSSKIAFGLFAMELQRRSDAAGWGIQSNLSHPGITPTNLLSAQPGMGRPQDTTAVKIIRAMSRRGILFGTPASAALSAVYAATSPDAEGGRLYGPKGFRHLSGPPAEQRLYSRLQDGMPRTACGNCRSAWSG